MMVAIQQPEHLPWIGFFNKMAQCDLYVYLDNVQFKKRYFENRNRIMTKEGTDWITVAVKTKGRYTQKINNVIIDSQIKWQNSYLGIIEHAYKKSPYWHHVRDIVFPCVQENTQMLIELNLRLIEECRKYLNINTPTILASTLGVDSFSGSRLIGEICLKTGADIYISGPNGKNYLNLQEFKDSGINVMYHHFKHPAYSQGSENFVPYLSIIDLIANCGPQSTSIIRDCYKINFHDGN